MTIPVLDNDQLDRLSEIFGNMGLVFLAALVVPVFTDVDRPPLFVVILGVVLTLLFFVISLVLLRLKRTKKRK